MDKVGLVTGICIRITLFWFGLKLNIRYFDSPYTSINTYKEGVAYISNGISPYFEGSPVHAPPIMLYGYYFISDTLYFSVLLLTDLISTHILNKITKVMFTKNKYSSLLYFLNPFSIYMNTTLSATPIISLVLLLFIYFSINRRRIKAAFVLSLLWYLDPSYGILSSLWFFQNFTLRIYLHSLFSLIILLTASNLLGTNWVFFI